ncbi:hypothetical protein BY458DRAFT_458239 [Sporodiniella umbellata]|nr:hypothetical protein BY458DRAFT_458239 [Sporodiniella umbellata]
MMSLNTVIALTLLLKKVTRKRNFERKPSYPDSNCSYSSSGSEREEEEELDKRCSIQPSFKTALQSSFDDILTHALKEDPDTSSMKEEPTTEATIGFVNIRDFAYAKDSPLHFGNPLPDIQSTLSLSSPDFNGRDARALFDFVPEAEYEVGLKAGQTIWVQYRECPGWLIADVQDQTGLVPESYVELI